MNNHWDTNYKADQEGPATFRYAIWSHGAFRAEDTARFGVDCSQPLLVRPASGPGPGQAMAAAVFGAGARECH